MAVVPVWVTTAARSVQIGVESADARSASISTPSPKKFEIVTDESRAYINSVSGDLASLSSEDVALADDDEVDPTDLPEWQADALPRIRGIAFGDEWHLLPPKFEIHERDFMRRFADQVTHASTSDACTTLRRRGAFGAFRDAVDRAGLEDDWFAFRRDALRQVAAARR